MRDELDRLVAAWQDAWFTKDAPAIAQMMAEDYVYVAPNGAIMDRAAILGIVGDPSYGLTDGAHTEMIVIMLGEGAALVRHRWRGTATFRGQTFVEDHRCVTICDRSSGRWRIRYEQCSAIGA
ncbi:MAG TPA: nuclear transport factor 2 family protein [Gemmatimonadales bacterium]|nr:nuclear transport factor 2 family protein [Gemmatimonadales bacterium]